MEGAAGADFYHADVGDTVVDLGDDGTDFVWALADFTVTGSSRIEVISVMSLAGQNWGSAFLAADRAAAFVDLVDDFGIAAANPDADLTGNFRTKC